MISKNATGDGTRQYAARHEPIRFHLLGDSCA